MSDCLSPINTAVYYAITTTRTRYNTQRQHCIMLQGQWWPNKAGWCPETEVCHLAQAKTDPNPDSGTIQLVIEKVAWEEIQPGKYIVVTYECDWFVSYTVERSEENRDVLVDFMHLKVQLHPSNGQGGRTSVGQDLITSFVIRASATSTGYQYTLHPATENMISEAFEALAECTFGNHTGGTPISHANIVHMWLFTSTVTMVTV